MERMRDENCGGEADHGNASASIMPALTSSFRSSSVSQSFSESLRDPSPTSLRSASPTAARRRLRSASKPGSSYRELEASSVAETDFGLDWIPETGLESSSGHGGRRASLFCGLVPLPGVLARSSPELWYSLLFFAVAVAGLSYWSFLQYNAFEQAFGLSPFFWYRPEDSAQRVFGAVHAVWAHNALAAQTLQSLMSGVKAQNLSPFVRPHLAVAVLYFRPEKDGSGPCAPTELVRELAQNPLQDARASRRTWSDAGRQYWGSIEEDSWGDFVEQGVEREVEGEMGQDKKAKAGRYEQEGGVEPSKYKEEKDGSEEEEDMIGTKTYNEESESRGQQIGGGEVDQQKLSQEHLLLESEKEFGNMGKKQPKLHKRARGPVDRSLQAQELRESENGSGPGGCVTYSQLGLQSPGVTDWNEYIEVLLNITKEIKEEQLVLIMEPGALCSNDSIIQSSMGNATQEFAKMKEAVKLIKGDCPNVRVLLSGCSCDPVQSPIADLAARMNASGIQEADGFALNVGLFDRTLTCAQYGQSLQTELRRKELIFVIDTSRNGERVGGSSSSSSSCVKDPPFVSLGHPPTTSVSQIGMILEQEEAEFEGRRRTQGARTLEQERMTAQERQLHEELLQGANNDGFPNHGPQKNLLSVLEAAEEPHREDSDASLLSFLPSSPFSSLPSALYYIWPPGWSDGRLYSRYSFQSCLVQGGKGKGITQREEEYNRVLCDDPSCPSDGSGAVCNKGKGCWEK